MQRLLSCLIVTAAATLALPAAAQQQPPSRPGPPQQQQPQRVLPDRPSLTRSAWVRAEYESFLDSASGNNLPAQSLERIDLANRVSTLIELGRCTDARNEAREAGDRQMAIRARQLCRADRNPTN